MQRAIRIRPLVNNTSRAQFETDAQYAVRMRINAPFKVNCFVRLRYGTIERNFETRDQAVQWAAFARLDMASEADITQGGRFGLD